MSVSTDPRATSGNGAADAQRPAPAMYEDAVLGFRNHWYPAMFSSQVGETEIKPLTLLGENILFKRVDGQVHAVRDECLHRGFRFSAKPECYTKNTRSHATSTASPTAGPTAPWWASRPTRRAS